MESNEFPTIPEQKSSFKLTKNAKGEYQWEIKVYADMPEDIQKQVKSMDDWAREKYNGSQ